LGCRVGRAGKKKRLPLGDEGLPGHWEPKRGEGKIVKRDQVGKKKRPTFWAKREGPIEKKDQNYETEATGERVKRYIGTENTGDGPGGSGKKKKRGNLKVRGDKKTPPSWMLLERGGLVAEKKIEKWGIRLQGPHVERERPEKRFCGRGHWTEERKREEGGAVRKAE